MEDKTLNFTTQNSFLHYGVKGMKWGVITSLYEKVGRQAHGRAETARRNSPGYRNPGVITTNSHSSNHPNPRQKNVTGVGKVGGNVTYGKNQSAVNIYQPVSGGSVSGRPGGYGNSRAVEQGKKDAEKEKKATMRITDEEMAKNAIETSNAHAQGKMIGDDKEKETTTAFAGIDKDADAYAAERGKYVNTVNKYLDAMDSIADMDPKYTKQFFEKYSEDITTHVKSYEQETALLYARILHYTDNNPEALPDNLVKEVETRQSEIKKDLYGLHIRSDNDLVSAKEGMQYDDELIDKVLKNIK